MSQYALNLKLPPVFSADNFFVSGCNKEAWQWIQAWPQWPKTSGKHALILHGPSGSGKSHLGHIWAAHAHAITVNAENIEHATIESGNWLIEDIDRIALERPLLHLFNYVMEQGGSMLMTSLLPAANLPFTLPDLTSRLLALPSVQIEQPDDDVLAGAMRKQFADRQMKVDDEVIGYIVPRMERSLAKAKELVELLDGKALAQSKSITIPFVRKILESL